MVGPTMWRALEHFGEAVDTGCPGVELAFGRPIFDHLHADPDAAASFNRMMVTIHGTEPASVAAAYDFSGIGHLVDVGGGIGTMLRSILAAHPGVRGTLFDLPGVLEQADLGGVADRCDTAAGSFFETVPAGADAYLLSHIVHDWGEAEIRTILGHCRDGLAGGGRVLLVEMVLPDGDEPHPGKLLDLAMLALVGGRERTAAEYGTLLADSGLRMTRVVPTSAPYICAAAGTTSRPRIRSGSISHTRGTMPCASAMPSSARFWSCPSIASTFSPFSPGSSWNMTVFSMSS